VIFALFMISTSIPNIIKDKASVDLISGQLGFPEYFIPFLGYAKILGSIAILIPGFPRIKEWAYAGLFFDLAGAFFAGVAKFGFQPQSSFMFIFIAFHLASYFLYHAVNKQADVRS
jgi:uncharacterized membrane protein YphA (DoxX/SURF4 family)